MFNRVYRLEIQLAMLVFLTGFVTYCLSNLLVGLLSPPPFPCVNKYRGMYSDSVGGLGIWGHLPQSPFTEKYFGMTTFGIASYQSNLSKWVRHIPVASKKA